MKASVQVIDSLITLFKALADAVDGEERLPNWLKKAYNKELDKPEMQAFYSQLVKENNNSFFLAQKEVQYYSGGPCNCTPKFYCGNH
jgi:hypothetical protein